MASLRWLSVDFHPSSRSGRCPFSDGKGQKWSIHVPGLEVTVKFRVPLSIGDWSPSATVRSYTLLFCHSIRSGRHPGNGTVHCWDRYCMHLML